MPSTTATVLQPPVQASRPAVTLPAARRGRSAGEMLLVAGVVLVVAPMAVVLLAVATLLAVVLAGPFFLGAILLLALIVVAGAAIGVSA